MLINLPLRIYCVSSNILSTRNHSEQSIQAKLSAIIEMPMQSLPWNEIYYQIFQIFNKHSMKRVNKQTHHISLYLDKYIHIHTYIHTHIHTYMCLQMYLSLVCTHTNRFTGYLLISSIFCFLLFKGNQKRKNCRKRGREG